MRELQPRTEPVDLLAAGAPARLHVEDEQNALLRGERRPIVENAGRHPVAVSAVPPWAALGDDGDQLERGDGRPVEIRGGVARSLVAQVREHRLSVALGQDAQFRRGRVAVVRYDAVLWQELALPGFGGLPGVCLGR